MNTRHTGAWDQDIRRYVFSMLSLVLIFVVIVAYYRAWYQSYAAKLTNRAHNYHLVSVHHYTMAREKLGLIEQDLSYHNTLSTLRLDETQSVGHDKRYIHWPVVVISEEIGRALQLQTHFRDAQLKALSDRIDSIISYFRGARHENIMSAQQRQQTQVALTRLRRTLDQLIRLHKGLYEQKIDQLREMNARFAHSFYLLLAVMVIASILTTRRGMLAISKIIKMHHEAEARIQHQAFYDALTNLPNRLLTLERLSYQIAESQAHNEHVALLYIDLDDFKKINDSLGHPVGDELLKQVAVRLRECVRATDTIGRLSGDEFVLILGGLSDYESVSLIAENLIIRTSQPYTIGRKDLLVTASVGIAIYPNDGLTPPDLLKKADSAMYHSKKLGRNMHSYFTQEMHREVERRLTVEQALVGAIERGEIEVFYQPQYDLLDNKIMGAEALLRWTNNTLGVISPAEFVPLAEHSDAIILLGKFVLSKALQMASEWQKNYLTDFRISVNLSPRQFRDKELVTYVMNALKQSGVQSCHLELEITEGLLLGGCDDVKNALNLLANAGISLAMDDFGTGYSSLSYLRQYPFNVVKIDQSFVRDIVIDPNDRELINAAIRMAHSLQLGVIAEGVETDAQLAQLKALQCDIAQGFLFSEAVSAEQMTALLTREKLCSGQTGYKVD